MTEPLTLVQCYNYRECIGSKLKAVIEGHSGITIVLFEDHKFLALKSYVDLDGACESPEVIILTKVNPLYELYSSDLVRQGLDSLLGNQGP